MKIAKKNNQTTRPINEEAMTIAQSMRQGHIVLFPSDTVWAIGCDAENTAACHRIREIKKVVEKGKQIILVDSISRLKKYVKMIHPRVETLLGLYHRPITFIYWHGLELPDHLIARDGSVAIRVVHDQFCKKIIETLDRPIIASLPVCSEKEAIPASIDEIDTNLTDQVDYISQIELIKKNALPSIIASYDRKGDLTFHRE